MLPQNFILTNIIFSILAPNENFSLTLQILCELLIGCFLMPAPFVREQKSVNAQSFVVKRSLRLFEDIYNLTLIHHSSIISHQLFRKQHKQQPQTEWFALHCEQLCCSFTTGFARSLQNTNVFCSLLLSMVQLT